MNLLFRIVYAAHASGTHHKLALDALRHLQSADAALWQGLLLEQARLYLEGSKAPDNAFKDFKNHVLHTRDNYWGGAPDKVRSWYQKLVEALAARDWPTAAYAAGVLSHYYTDPLHPFHTGQSEAENNIHRAVEWSISRAYDALAAQGEIEFRDMGVEVPAGPNWLVELLCRGAEMANSRYESLIAHYDFQRGVVDPPAGLDRVARRMMAQLIRYASLSFAAVLDRAIAEANVRPPEVSLAAATLSAIGQVPFKLIAKRITNAEERRLIERMYDELNATGKVEANLPEDDRAVRDLHAAEVLAKRAASPDVSKVFPFVPREAPPAARSPAPAMEAAPPQASNVIPLRAPAPAVAAAVPETEVGDDSAEQAPARPARIRPTSGLMAQLEGMTIAPLAPRGAEPAAPQPAAPRPAAEAKPTAEVRGPSHGPRYHLAPDHDVVDGPSIGPKTAERLYAQGVKTVGDLLHADAETLAELLDTRHITLATVTDWKDQARLVCSVPELRGTHAQLLVGAGYRTAEALAAAEADKLCADVLAFAATQAGQRLLRSGEAPDIERIKGWLEAARSVEAA